jgi:putative ABC transport system permease protein
MESEKVYAALLHLYPAAFREEYGGEMRAAFRRRRREEPNALRRSFLWLSVFTDTVITAAREHFDMLMHDIRYSLRTLQKTPAFTIAALTTLALGIGATTAIYSLVHTVLLRPLPYVEPDRLVQIVETNKPLNISQFSVSYLNFLSWQERSQSFESLATFGGSAGTLTGDGEPQRVAGAAVSPDFFSMTGLKPVLGRTFLPEESVPGKDNVVMLGEGLWRSRFGGDPNIIGKAILLSGTQRVVVGIAPQDAGYTSANEIWTPLVLNPAEEDRGNHVMSAMARLRPGVSMAQAEAELNSIAEALEREFPKSNAGWRARLRSAEDWIIDKESRTSLYVLLAAVGLLLTAACANVAGLLVTRATARAHEFGMRLALGAGRSRLTRQLVTESLVLAGTGGAFGTLLAVGSIQWLAKRVTNQLPRTTNLTLDWPVLLFAFFLTMSVGLVFGLAPAWSARRADVMSTLRKAGRGMTGGGGALLRLGLVGGQIAIATMLVIGALLLIQSFARLQRVNVGFQADHLLTANLNLPVTDYPTPEKREVFYENLLAELRGLPGVVSVAITSAVPMGRRGNTSMPIVPVDRPADVPEQGVQAQWRWASEDYLSTLRVPLLRGAFSNSAYSKRSGIVLSETLVRHLWPDGTDPIGRQVRLGNGAVFTVIGVAGDVKMTDLRAEPVGEMYFKPFYGGTLTLVARTTGDPNGLIGPLRDTVRRHDPSQAVFSIRSMDELVETNADRSRLQTTLLTAFACLALVLGAVGVAGVVAYTVERRTPELALRLVLGSTPGQAMRNAAQAALTSSCAGLLLGLIGAWVLSESLLTLLYGVRPHDPATFITVGTALLAVAVIACWLPARRATRIDPGAALKQE